MTSGPRTRPIPWLTLAVSAGLVVVYAVSDPWLRGFWAISRESVADGGWFRLFTAVAHHADLGHLLQNILALVLLGGLLEQRVGASAFGLVLLASALVGAVCSSLFVLGSSVGASGGIYGIVGMWLVLLARMGRGERGPGDLPGGLWLIVLLFLLADSVLGALGVGRPAELEARVDWAAHAGGLATGCVLGWVGVRSGPASGVARTRAAWVRPAALVLGASFVLAGWVGWLRFGDGGPDTLRQLPDGPAKWLLVNNAAWEAATTGRATRAQLLEWRGLMELVVERQTQVPEYADTLASLHLVLGEPWKALEIERDVSWQLEIEPYLLQFARFAWAAFRSGDAAPKQHAVPERIVRVESEPGDPGLDRDAALRFRVVPAAGARPPRALDILCLLGTEPIGMLRILAGGPGVRQFDLPLRLLRERGSRSERDPAALRLIGLSGRGVLGVPDPEPGGSTLHFWPRSRAEFESRAQLGD